MLSTLYLRLKNFFEGLKEEGQGLVEYALIIVLIAIVVIAALIILGPAIGNVFNGIADVVNDYPAAP